ncbi:serine/threonine-protein kinase [Streptomyces sp. NPDC093252]|uniref:serine/threonine protein kinase n=1 Tax=Streptomyces sp. NPDC093252 TaxID=3154980 RepID=UPI003442AD16
MNEIHDIGDITNHYKVEGRFDDGGYGDLYIGSDLRSEKQVAIKTQKPWRIGAKSIYHSDGRRLVEEEGSHMITLSGIEAIPKLIAKGTYRTDRCLVMEFIKGRQLRTALEEEPPIKDPATVASIIGQLCEIFRDVHEKNLVHCDLKPENVIVEPDGRLRLIDMGQAVRMETPTDDYRGTPGYASPEQLDANPDGLTAGADIFTLGAMLLEMTVMHLPYGGLERRVEIGHPVLPADLVAKIPAEFHDLALHMVQWNPEDRPKDVQEVFDRIRCHLPEKGSRRPRKPLRPDPTEYYRTRAPRLWHRLPRGTTSSQPFQ